MITLRLSQFFNWLVNPFILCGISFLIAISTFVFQRNQETRYLLPLIPFVVILTLGIIKSFHSQTIDRLAGLIFSVQLSVVTLVAFGVLNAGGFVSKWVEPIDLDGRLNQSYNNLINELCKTSNSKTSANYIVGNEQFINFNIFQYDTIKLDRSGIKYSCGFLPVYVLEEKDPLKMLDKVVAQGSLFLLVPSVQKEFDRTQLQTAISLRSDLFILVPELSSPGLQVYSIRAK